MSNNETAACRGCGILAPGAQWYEQHAGVMNGKVIMPGRFQRATCPDCVSLDFNRPGVAVRACLRLIGRPETDDALFAEVLTDNGFDAAEVLFPGGPPSHRPWSHAHDVRRDLRRLYTKVLLKRIEPKEKPVPVPPPAERGHEADRCLICGAAEDFTWNGYATLSTRGGGRVTGCLCGSRCSPVFAHIGNFGTQFEGNAYLAFRGEPVDLTLDRIPGLRTWYMLSDIEKKAVTGPWSWVPEPEPIAPIEEPQGITVEALAAQVAQLQHELAILRGTQV